MAKKGKSGAPAKPKSSTPSESSSKGNKAPLGRGARRFPNGGMTQLQKVLLVNGGIGHRLRKSGSAVKPMRTRKTRSDERAA